MVTLGQRVEHRAAEVNEERAHAAMIVVTNAVLGMAVAGDRWRDVNAKRDRIIARIAENEDAYPIGTPERNEAEARVRDLLGELASAEDEIIRLAKRVTGSWDVMGRDWGDYVLSVLLLGYRSDSPAWGIVERDRTLSQHPVMIKLLRAVSSVPANSEAVPF